MKMTVIDKKRMQDAIDKAFDTAVERLLDALIRDLIEAGSPNRPQELPNEQQSVGKFRRTFKLIVSAYSVACDEVSKFSI